MVLKGKFRLSKFQILSCIITHTPNLTSIFLLFHYVECDFKYQIADIVFLPMVGSSVSYL